MMGMGGLTCPRPAAASGGPCRPKQPQVEMVVEDVDDLGLEDDGGQLVGGWGATPLRTTQAALLKVCGEQ